MDNTKLLPIIRIIIAALIIELTVCNFSFWKSLLNKEDIIFEDVTIEGAGQTHESPDEYVVLEDNPTLHISGVDTTFSNIFLGTYFAEGTAVPYTIMLTDEGSHYPYALPERTITSGIEKSHYTNIYPSGKVRSIDVQFSLAAGNVLTLGEIRGNVRIPFMFSLVRFLFILGALLLLRNAIYTEQWKTVICNGTKKQFFATAAVAFLLIGMAWALAHINPICITSPWPHHKQYQELAEVMAKGQLYLDAEPSETILAAENPYDTIYLQANGIDYLADYAYYDGKYYVYFGVVPELLLYFPFYMLTGHHLPNYIAVFIFYCGFILAVFALYREIIKRWFVHTPYFIYLMTCVLTVCCGNYLFIIARPDLYDTPIMAANMFTAGGIWLWIKGKYSETPKSRRLRYFLGSLSMALVAGCRPQMLLFSLLALPLFGGEIRKIFRNIGVHIRKNKKLSAKASIDSTVSSNKQSSVDSSSNQTDVDSPGQSISGNTLIIDAAFICIPYILIAAGIMYYNAARFGQAFDFGATYSLTSNDMTKRSFNISQALLGLWHYFLRPPIVSSDFPFLQGLQVASGSYMGKLNAEYTYGGILASNAFLWILLYFNRGKDLLKKRGVYVFSLICIAISVILSIVDVTGAGILQRYMVDMIWGIWLAAALLWFACAEMAVNNETLKPLMLTLTAVCLLQAAYGFGVVLGNGDLSVNVRMSNPRLYYYLGELFRF